MANTSAESIPEVVSRENHASAADFGAANGETATNDQVDSADRMDELRRLLVAPEQQRLGELQQQIDANRIDVSSLGNLLPDAIALRPKSDHRLSKALQPSVEEAIQVSVKRNPKVLTDAIFPLMGPSIRKAIAAALSSMLQSLNQTLSHSFSWRGVKWRLEALRTGKSFAEVVMLHTLRYRVEQVFLIHRETGLLLQHVVAGSGAVQDADMVSGMLTALQDFVHDSFRVQKGGALETIQVSGFTVWIEQGPLAVIAAAIRGEAPLELKAVLQETLELFHAQYHNELASFSGDSSIFEPFRGELESCLQAQYGIRAEDSVKRRLSPIWIILILALIGFGIWGYFVVRDNHRWGAYLARLQMEPGIVVTAAEKHGGKFFVTGLRDPLAADPESFLKESRVSPADVVSRWEPYLALTPDFTLARARQILAPPAGASLKLDQTVLVASGAAPHQWIAETRRLARMIPGISKFEAAGLADADLKAIAPEKAWVEGQTLRFIKDTSRFMPGQTDELQRLLGAIQRMGQFAHTHGYGLVIEISGHTDTDSSEDRNMKLSQQRADLMSNLLQVKGLNVTELVAKGVGASQPIRAELTELDRTYNRSVSFRVTLSDETQNDVDRRGYSR